MAGYKTGSIRKTSYLTVSIQILDIDPPDNHEGNKRILLCYRRFKQSFIFEIYYKYYYLYLN